MMLLPPVVVDLGPEVARAQLEIVLDACNDAITRGVCVESAAAGAEAPRAVARARAADASARVVRIEVRLAAGEAAPIVRELRFAGRDPVPERWRSVGLAIATLVGEGEQLAQEEAAGAGEPERDDSGAVVVPVPPPAPPAPAEAAPPSEPASSEPAPPEPAPPEPTPPPPEELEARAAEPEVVLEPSPPEPPLDFSHRPLFVGLGALVGTGFDAGTWRAGGNLRAVWHFEWGLSILASTSYALGTSDDPFAVRWLAFEAGVGYRWVLSERLSVGGSVLLGTQRASYEASDPESSASRFSPRIGLLGDVAWRLVPPFGLWAALDGTTTGRKTRVFVASGEEPAETSPFSAALYAGFGFWFR